MFHLTSLSSLNSILDHGLIPQMGKNSIMFGEEIPKIFLFPNENSAADALGSWMEDCFNDDQVVLLKVDTANLSVVPAFENDEDNTSWEWSTEEIISPSRITVMSKNF